MHWYMTLCYTTSAILVMLSALLADKAVSAQVRVRYSLHTLQWRTITSQYGSGTTWFLVALEKCHMALLES